MAKIWHPDNEVSLEAVNAYNNDSLHASLDIRFTEIGDGFVKGTMPVNNKTIQPYGLLHGGASVALAESLGSTGAGLRVDHRKYKVVGQEINANHVRSATEGIVTGIAKPIYFGKRTQVWEIKIYNSASDFNDATLCCVSRMTAMHIKIEGS